MCKDTFAGYMCTCGSGFISHIDPKNKTEVHSIPLPWCSAQQASLPPPKWTMLLFALRDAALHCSAQRSCFGSARRGWGLSGEALHALCCQAVVLNAKPNTLLRRCAWTSTSACRRTRRRWTRTAPATAAPARTYLAATSAPLHPRKTVDAHSSDTLPFAIACCAGLNPFQNQLIQIGFLRSSHRMPAGASRT